MKKMLQKLIYSPLLIIGFLSCSKLDTPIEQPYSGNKVPIANAGADLTTFLPKDSVVLDGTASVDPDGTITYFHWSKTSGPASHVFIDSATAQALVKNLVEGIYQFKLTVTDDRGVNSNRYSSGKCNKAAGFTEWL